MACYSSGNGYAGYHNYMKYWAKNGSPNWICSLDEYPVQPDGQQHNGYEHEPVYEFVQYNYASVTFWNNFKPDADGYVTNPVGKREQPVWSTTNK